MVLTLFSVFGNVVKHGARGSALTNSYVFHQAFFQGKIKIKGNMGLALKLKEIQPKPGKSKL